MTQVSLEQLRQLEPRKGGLTASEVDQQLKIYGKNEILDTSENKILEVLKDTLRDPMIWFLLVIGLIFSFLGEFSESLLLFLAIVPLVFMDAVLHWRTQSSVTLLKKELSAPIHVYREGELTTIDSRMLVPGDLIALKPGSYLPADGIFERTQELQMDESTLTGESLPISKKAFLGDLFLKGPSLQSHLESACIGSAGTRVLSGSGDLRITGTGRNTVYGQIIQSVIALKHQQTPLQLSIQKLIQFLILAAGVLCVLLAGVRVMQGHGWLDAFISSATLAIAAFPEEFPVVFSFFLGVGVYRLAKRKALVRRAVSIEDIGRVSFICTDKTGTITRGVLELSEFDLPSQVTSKDLFPMIQSAIDPISPDPVDVALLSKLGPSNHSTWSRVKVFPFTEDRKKETVILALSPSEQVAFVKGSPESILKMTELSEDQKSTWLIKVQHWAQQGSKVLGCARRKLTPQEADSTLEPCLDFEFCGLLVFKDTVRPEAKEALAYCRSNGIRVLMLTGDHLDTALAVAREVGLGAKAPQGISASEHPEMFSEDNLALKKNDFKNLDVIARCTPVEKLRIVNALKLSGETVAVTGDGVNDVPALKAAHIGIAMGERGSTSAKEVASIILMDDNFSTIVGAIKEGRQLFKNLQRSFIYLLLIHVPFVLTAAILPLMGYPLIYLPLHIVWLELIIHPTALFGFQQIADPSAASARHAKNFFYGQDLVRILFPSLLVTGLISLIFSQSIQSGALVPEARSKALILLLFWSAGNLALLTNLKTLSAKLVFGITVFSTVLIVQWTFLASFLKLEPLKMNDWLSLSTWTGLALFISWIFQRWGNRHANKA